MKIKALTSDDYIKAIKKVDRELELELNGGRWVQKSKPHKNKKKYNRKNNEDYI
jgi:hypothetical protein